MLQLYKSIKFLFVGPLILAMLFVINWMTSPEYWWVKWAALGIGIAWVVSLLRVIKMLVIVGGIAAFLAWYQKRGQQQSGTGTGPAF